MPRKAWPYVNSYRDRSGKMRHYFRRAGHMQIPLPGQPGSTMFVRAYEAAVAGTPRAPNLSRLKATGKVYFLSDGDYIKIGFTTNWERRSSVYLTHSARDLTLLALIPGTRESENSLHRKFQKSRINGEWFRRSEDILKFVRETSGEHEVTNDPLRLTKWSGKDKEIKAVSWE